MSKTREFRSYQTSSSLQDNGRLPPRWDVSTFFNPWSSQIGSQPSTTWSSGSTFGRGGTPSSLARSSASAPFCFCSTLYTKPAGQVQSFKPRRTLLLMLWRGQPKETELCDWRKPCGPLEHKYFQWVRFLIWEQHFQRHELLNLFSCGESGQSFWLLSVQQDEENQDRKSFF